MMNGSEATDLDMQAQNLGLLLFLVSLVVVPLHTLFPGSPTKRLSRRFIHWFDRKMAAIEVRFAMEWFA